MVLGGGYAGYYYTYTAWDVIRLDLNNDFDFTLGPATRPFVPGVDPVVRSYSIS